MTCSFGRHGLPVTTRAPRPLTFSVTPLCAVSRTFTPARSTATFTGTRSSARPAAFCIRHRAAFWAGIWDGVEGGNNGRCHHTHANPRGVKSTRRFLSEPSTRNCPAAQQSHPTFGRLWLAHPPLLLRKALSCNHFCDVPTRPENCHNHRGQVSLPHSRSRQGGAL